MSLEQVLLCMILFTVLVPIRVVPLICPLSNLLRVRQRSMIWSRAGVHFEYEGRQYGALSVVRKIMEVMWGFSGTTTR